MQSNHPITGSNDMPVVVVVSQGMQAVPMPATATHHPLHDHQPLQWVAVQTVQLSPSPQQNLIMVQQQGAAPHATSQEWSSFQHPWSHAPPPAAVVRMLPAASTPLPAAMNRHGHVALQAPQHNFARAPQADQQRQVAAPTSGLFLAATAPPTAPTGMQQRTPVNVSPIGAADQRQAPKKSHKVNSANHATGAAATTAIPSTTTTATAEPEVGEASASVVDGALAPQTQRCHYCNAPFPTKALLKIHLRAHKGKELFKCEICGKQFAEKNSHKVHMRVHSGERPFKCSMCDKSFAQKGNLTVHLRTHTGERPHACEVCGKCFTERGSLTKHKRIHIDKRPYVCQLCPKSFTVQCHLKAHLRTHTGERPHVCQVCNKGFTVQGSLSRHMRSHHAAASAASAATD